MSSPITPGECLGQDAIPKRQHGPLLQPRGNGYDWQWPFHPVSIRLHRTDFVFLRLGEALLLRVSSGGEWLHGVSTRDGLRVCSHLYSSECCSTYHFYPSFCSGLRPLCGGSLHTPSSPTRETTADTATVGINRLSFSSYGPFRCYSGASDFIAPYRNPSV